MTQGRPPRYRLSPTDLFEPEVVLPSQLIDAKRSVTPEMRLLAAILADAVTCLQPGVSQNLFAEAERWVMTKDLRWPFSYDNVCAVLGVDPTHLRQVVRAHTRRPLAKVTAPVDTAVVGAAPVLASDSAPQLPPAAEIAAACARMDPEVLAASLLQSA